MKSKKFNKTLPTLLVVICTHFTIKIVSGYSCQTPNRWLETAAFVSLQYDNLHDVNLQLHDNVSTGFTLSANIRPVEKWPGGVVPYKLHESLSPDDIREVKQAFREFHKKTCIRFRPWSPDDPNYTSIETDNSVCGKANVCMRGGPQYAKFGQNCITMTTMVHELGHTLCLDHEQERFDRDEYLNFESCHKDSRPRKRRNANVRGLYDYSSQMHYGCNPCPIGFPKGFEQRQCGGDVTVGLSIMDADHLNNLYGCGGCFRHRWRHIELFTEEERRQNMYIFDIIDTGGNPLLPCRTSFHGNVIVGKYTAVENLCYIGYNGTEHKILSKFEVLTVPGGLGLNENSSVNAQYKLADVHQGMSKDDLQCLWNIAVPAGHLSWADGSGDGNSFVAFVTYPDIMSRNVGKGSFPVSNIGSVYRNDSEPFEFPQARFSFGGRDNLTANHYKVLVCKS